MDKSHSSYIKRLLVEALNHFNKGKFQQAKKIYLELINLTSEEIDAFNNLGMIEVQHGNLLEAISFFNKSISTNPNQSGILFYLGNCYLGLSKFSDAILSYDAAIKLDPSFAEAHNNLGNALQELDRLDDALAAYSRAIALNPNYIDAFNNQANVLVDLGKFDEALSSYTKAILLNKDDPEVYFNRGICLDKLGKFDEALLDYNLAIFLDPEYAEAYFNRGVTNGHLKKFNEAIIDYDRAIELNPNYSKAYFNRGGLHQELRQFNEALIDYDQVLIFEPNFEQTYLQRGAAFFELNWIDESLLSYERAIELKSDYVEAYLGYGHVLHELKRFDEALLNYARLNELQPDRIIVLEQIIASKMMACDWEGYDECLNKIVNNKEQASIIFNLLALIDDPQFHKAAAETYIKNNFPLNKLLPDISTYPPHKKIRVGYFSVDFHEHPVAYLTAEMFELHNRQQFEVVAFSCGRASKTAIRKRLENAFDVFLDVRNKSDLEVVELAREMEIDIAVDLAGFTRGSRTNIFALRAAPIQLSYIGYLGTLGAEYYDYLIADPVIIPKNHQQYFNEKVVCLPSYQVNDSKREISEKVFTREEVGLPRDGFVFCCFNNIYKITPNVFDGWMRILGAVKGSVLLLLDANETATKNLKKEAATRGIHADRIIFAKHLPSPEYIARYRVADLFLDTTPYNAGTTASDALRVGLPVLTKIGKSFASRMAASLLNALNLPDLIVSSQEDYEAFAIRLASNPKELYALKSKLLSSLSTSRLYNSEFFTRHIELAYIQMYERYQKGMMPDHIYVDAE